MTSITEEVKIKHRFTLEVNATVENFKKAMCFIDELDADIKQWELTTKPQQGEVWKDGHGDEHVIDRVTYYASCEYPLFDVNQPSERTWKSTGVYLNSPTDPRNLVERVSCVQLKISKGEYWIDDKDEIHHILGVYPNCIASKDNMWSLLGKSSTCNLVSRVSVVLANANCGASNGEPS